MDEPRPPLIEARGLTKHFHLRRSLLARVVTRARDQTVHAVDDVNLQICPGETLGLVGESGCGKTTLGRLLVRLYEPTAGQVHFEGQPVKDGMVSVRQNGAAVQEPFYRVAQIIFQNPYASLNPRKTVRQILSVPLAHRGLADPLQREWEIQQLLSRVGLNPRHADAYPHQFSGGQRQRVGIARALAMRPRFVVADEPVSSLDVSIQAQVVLLLQELQKEYHLTFLFITHDLSLVHQISDDVAVMYLGQIVEQGPTEALFREPLHPYTQALLAAVPSVDKALRRQRIILGGTVPSAIDPPSGCRFHPRCFVPEGKVCDTEQPPFFQVGDHKVACWRYNNG
jgi:oligopeptide/dipeptide ABC transporter ATP-binding protein